MWSRCGDTSAAHTDVSHAILFKLLPGVIPDEVSSQTAGAWSHRINGQLCLPRICISNHHQPRSHAPVAIRQMRDTGNSISDISTVWPTGADEAKCFSSRHVLLAAAADCGLEGSSTLAFCHSKTIRPCQRSGYQDKEALPRSGRRCSPVLVIVQYRLDGALICSALGER